MPALPFRLKRTPEADEALTRLDQSEPKRAKAVRKAIGLLQQNPRHPSLNTHLFASLAGPNGERVFEAYAENNRPSPYRLFFYYEPGRVIVVLAIVQHPD